MLIERLTKFPELGLEDQGFRTNLEMKENSRKTIIRALHNNNACA
jgi:hypothetical protein